MKSGSGWIFLSADAFFFLQAGEGICRLRRINVSSLWDTLSAVSAGIHLFTILKLLGKILCFRI